MAAAAYHRPGYSASGNTLIVRLHPRHRNRRIHTTRSPQASPSTWRRYVPWPTIRRPSPAGRDGSSHTGQLDGRSSSTDGRRFKWARPSIGTGKARTIVTIWYRGRRGVAVNFGLVALAPFLLREGDGTPRRSALRARRYGRDRRDARLHAAAGRRRHRRRQRPREARPETRSTHWITGARNSYNRMWQALHEHTNAVHAELGRTRLEVVDKVRHEEVDVISLRCVGQAKVP